MSSLGGIRGGTAHSGISAPAPPSNVLVSDDEVKAMCFKRMASFSVCLLLMTAGVTVGIWAALN
jgi:hypothetical protein